VRREDVVVGEAGGVACQHRCSEAEFGGHGEQRHQLLWREVLLQEWQILKEEVVVRLIEVDPNPSKESNRIRNQEALLDAVLCIDYPAEDQGSSI